MSNGKQGENDENRQKENRPPGDIRNYLSPPPSSNRSTPRRRRVITSDSDDDALHGGGGPAMLTHQTMARSADASNRTDTTEAPTAAPSSPPVHHVSSDDDSMFIAGVRNPRRNASQEQPVNIRQRSAPIATKASTKTATPRATQATGTTRARGKRSRSSRFVGEATEDSTNDDHTSDYSSDCIEMDTNGADLYRQAVSSLRNANNARNQLRAATTKCRVCAQFAAYLQHFL